LSVNADPTALKSPDDEFQLWVIDESATGSDLKISEAGPPH